MRYLFVTLLSFLLVENAVAQDEVEVESFAVADFPLANYGSDAKELLFSVFDDGKTIKLFLTKKSTIVNEELFSYEFEDYFVFNSAKSGAMEWRNDTIRICSEMPFKATTFCCMIPCKNKQFGKPVIDARDPSYEAIDKAEKALSEGKIAEAVQYYHGVMYPMSYLNEEEVGADIMQKAHELSLAAFKKGDYKNAVNTMTDALTYYVNQQYLSFSDEKSLIEKMNDNTVGHWNMEKFKLWLGDYGLFLLKAKMYGEAIVINSYLNKVQPQMIGPYLQLGDACFEKGDKPNAKIAYRNYKSLMQKAKRDKQIPKRVHDRIK